MKKLELVKMMNLGRFKDTMSKNKYYLVAWLIDLCGLVAQRIAHLTSDQKVVGSSPIAVIFYYILYLIIIAIFCCFVTLL